MAIWNAVANLNTSIKEIKKIVKMKKQFNIRKENKDSSVKIRIIRERIRYFYRMELARYLKPCLNEIWQEIRNPKSGEYLLRSIKV